jgi:hypothetical protein
MQSSGMENRRGFIKRLAAVVGGLAAVPVLARPAQAGRSRWRGGWGGYGYGGWSRRSWSHRRFWGPGFPYGGSAVGATDPASGTAASTEAASIGRSRAGSGRTTSITAAASIPRCRSSRNPR